MPLPRSHCLSVKVVKRSLLPKTIGVTDEEFALVKVKGHGVWSISLKLQRMSPCLSNGIDDLEGFFERAIMVSGHLGDNEGFLI
jgi:hypothetical protein